MKKLTTLLLGALLLAVTPVKALDLSPAQQQHVEFKKDIKTVADSLYLKKKNMFLDGWRVNLVNDGAIYNGELTNVQITEKGEVITLVYTMETNTNTFKALPTTTQQGIGDVYMLAREVFKTVLEESILSMEGFKDIATPEHFTAAFCTTGDGCIIVEIFNPYEMSNTHVYWEKQDGTGGWYKFAVEPNAK